MSNRLYIDEVSKPSTNLVGFHAYDDYDSCTAFNWDNGEKTPDDDMDFLFDILTHENGYPEELKEMLEFAKEHQKGVTIRDEYYDWDEIKGTYERAMKRYKQPSN